MDKIINTDSLIKLESSLKIKRVKNEREFNTIIKQETLILYLLVDWSGSERYSRYNFFNSTKKIKSIPVYILDCSSQKLTYLEKWLKLDSNEFTSIYNQGNGEILLIKNGKIVDTILNSHIIGIEKTKEIILNWV